MGLMSFIKDAGEKLFGKGEAKAAQEAAAKAPSPETIAALNATAGKAIADYVATQSLAVEGLDVRLRRRHDHRHRVRRRAPTRRRRRRCCCAAATCRACPTSTTCWW